MVRSIWTLASPARFPSTPEASLRITEIKGRQTRPPALNLRCLLRTCRGWMTPTLNLALIYGRQLQSVSLRIQQLRQSFIGLLS